MNGIHLSMGLNKLEAFSGIPTYCCAPSSSITALMPESALVLEECRLVASQLPHCRDWVLQVPLVGGPIFIFFREAATMDVSVCKTSLGYTTVLSKTSIWLMY